MENTRKSDVLAFCRASKVDLYSFLDRLQSGKFLTMQEQRNLILNQLQALDLVEHVTNQNEQNIAKLNQAESIVKSVQSVENLIQSSVYKFTQSWK